MVSNPVSVLRSGSWRLTYQAPAYQPSRHEGSPPSARSPGTTHTSNGAPGRAIRKTSTPSQSRSVSSHSPRNQARSVCSPCWGPAGYW